MENIRYSRLTDILQVIFLMSSKLTGVTIQDIQDECAVSRRTAERIRDAILNFLPSCDEIETSDRQKHWGITGYSVAEIIAIGADEIAALEKIKNNFDPSTNSELRRLATKLKAMNVKNKNFKENLELILTSEGLAIRQGAAYKTNFEDISILREAIKNNFKITAEYYGKKKVLTPLGLVFSEKLYLLAKEEEKGKDPYYYATHKLNNLKITKEKFSKGDFNLKEFTEKSFGIYQGEIHNVELLFSKGVSEDVLNYNFHPTQKIKQNKDGTITVKFQASGELHMIWNLFKWGADVKIIKPAKLKEEYREYLKNVLEGI